MAPAGNVPVWTFTFHSVGSAATSDTSGSIVEPFSWPLKSIRAGPLVPAAPTWMCAAMTASMFATVIA
jgi:hypothetical protein